MTASLTCMEAWIYGDHYTDNFFMHFLHLKDWNFNAISMSPLIHAMACRHVVMLNCHCKIIWLHWLVLSDILWKIIDYVGDYLHLKNVSFRFEVCSHHWTWDCTTFQNFLSKIKKIQEEILSMWCKKNTAQQCQAGPWSTLIFKSWQVCNWLAKWLIMLGFMDIKQPRISWHSNISLVDYINICLKPCSIFKLINTWL